MCPGFPEPLLCETQFQLCPQNTLCKTPSALCAELPNSNSSQLQTANYYSENLLDFIHKGIKTIWKTLKNYQETALLDFSSPSKSK